MQVAFLEQLLQVGFQRRRCDLPIAGQIVVFQDDTIEFALNIIRARSIDTINYALAGALTILDIVVDEFLSNQVALGHLVRKASHYSAQQPSPE